MEEEHLPRGKRTRAWKGTKTAHAPEHATLTKGERKELADSLERWERIFRIRAKLSLGASAVLLVIALAVFFVPEYLIEPVFSKYRNEVPKTTPASPAVTPSAGSSAAQPTSRTDDTVNAAAKILQKADSSRPTEPLPQTSVKPRE